ncbi:MAG: hypothetical protein JRF50_12995 [Deltaproteobacteria bacterium]|nr:hypothetical protein [Deltaproteobacteria bacterium]
MKIIDLSHTISPEMPVCPGTEPLTFTPACTMDHFEFVMKEITIQARDCLPIRAVAIIE